MIFFLSNASLHGHCDELLQGTAQLTLSQETREMAGGLTLRDGNVEVNCAFETQLRELTKVLIVGALWTAILPTD